MEIEIGKCYLSRHGDMTNYLIPVKKFGDGTWTAFHVHNHKDYYYLKSGKVRDGGFHYREYEFEYKSHINILHSIINNVFTVNNNIYIIDNNEI